MKRIYILNYQREIPPFAQLEISYAKKYFDEVIYVTRKLVNDNSSSVQDSNVKIIQIGLFERVFAFLRLIPLCFSKVVLIQILKISKRGHISLSYFKTLLLELYVSEQLYMSCRKCIRSVSRSENYVVSCWFSGVAIAAAKLQKKMHCKSYSFAHAFEVDPSRNRYVGYLLEDYKHKYLARISFIARTMLKKYADCVYPIIGVQSNAVVDYLGSEKKYSNNKKSSTEFTICSCSTVNEIKRLDLLVEALSYIKELPVHWIHLGDGPDLNDIKCRANSCLGDNVKFSFLGKLTNDGVQEFYSSNSVDLFLNVSRSEGLPISIMEAMSYSIPCMATDVGGTSEIVNNDNGVLLDPDISPKDLSVEIVRFLQQDNLCRHDMKILAYNNWNEKFNAKMNVSQYYIKMVTTNDGKQ